MTHKNHILRSLARFLTNGNRSKTSPEPVKQGLAQKPSSTIIRKRTVMDFLVTVYRKNNDELLFEAKSTEKGVVEFLKRFTNLNGFTQATFMHELRETGASSVLEENTLPYEVVASKL